MGSMVTAFVSFPVSGSTEKGRLGAETRHGGGDESLGVYSEILK
jgi:hypothetical protein